MTVNETIALEEVKSMKVEWAKFTFYLPNIVFVDFLKYRDEIDVPEAEIHCRTLEEITDKRPVHIIANFKNAELNFSNEAREFFAKHPWYSKLRLSQALVVNQLAHKIVANFYVRINSPAYPTRVFNNIGDAVKWTNSLRD